MQQKVLGKVDFTLKAKLKYVLVSKANKNIHKK